MLRTTLTALALTLPLAAPAQELTDDRIKQLALEAILENPEIVMQAVDILQRREAEAQAAAAQAALSENGGLLQNDPNAPIGGNPDGDVTVVEFFDYNCGFCRRAAPVMAELLDTDKEVRIVYREFPILSEESEQAARVALAARNQDAYEVLHKAMMTHSGRLGTESALELAGTLGLDVAQLRADMNAPEITAHIQTSRELATQLGVRGTPAFVIGDALAPGFIEFDVMQEMIAEARAE